MAVKTTTRPELLEENKAAFQDEPIEGIILEADYAEDRPVSLLAKRQRDFQKSLQGQYVDMEMPAAQTASIAREGQIMYLDELSAEVSQGDIFVSLPLVSATDGQEQPQIQRVSAILLTQDCEYDKPSALSVLIAAILPLSGVALGSQGNVRKNRVASAFYLPPHASFPESYVDLRAIGRISKSLAATEAQGEKRLLSLTEEARLALQRQIAGFFGYGR